jgi:hypothetical protein
MTMQSHSQAPLSADDRLDIQEVIARSAFNSDFQHWEEFASIYTEDAVTRTDSHDFLVEGVAGHVEHAKHSAQETAGKNRHLYFNFRIEATEDGAEAAYYLVNCNAGGVPLDAKIVTTGHMRAALVRTDDGWRIQRRRFTPDQAYKIDW